MSGSTKLQPRLVGYMRSFGRKISNRLQFQRRDTAKHDDLQGDELAQTGKEKQTPDEQIYLDSDLGESLSSQPSTPKLDSQQQLFDVPRYVAVAGPSTATTVQSGDHTEENEEGDENERKEGGKEEETNKTPVLGSRGGNDGYEDFDHDLHEIECTAMKIGDYDLYENVLKYQQPVGLPEERNDQQNNECTAMKIGDYDLYENVLKYQQPVGLPEKRNDQQNNEYTALFGTDSDGSYVDCFVFATCHELRAGSFLKISMLFLKSDSNEQQQEQIIKEKVGRMEFGKQVHEDCHYLSAAHKEDMSVMVSGLRGGWKTGANGDDNPVEQTFVPQVLRHRKLWDGKICIASYYFETLAGCQPELFGANFKIQQDGLVEEATVFDICEPIDRFTAQENDAKSVSSGFTVKSEEELAPGVGTNPSPSHCMNTL